MSFPRMPLHIGDYKKHTSHLRAPQHGAYLSLVMHYWVRGCLPQGDEQLAAIACMDIREWRKQKPIIKELFQEGWRLGWLDAELADASVARERRSAAGKKGNEKRWSDDGRSHEHADRYAFGNASHSDRNAMRLGSLPPTHPQGQEPQQGKNDSECQEAADETPGIVQFPRGRA